MKQKKKLMWNGAAFIAPIIAITLVMAAAHLYPFGGISNLRKDLDIQYIEYFAWLKRVLMGEASISYSFSKSLGGSLVALFGYYLNNPLNLLVVFFPHEKLPLFVFILSAVKLGLCGLTASVYFRSRFEKLSEWWVLLYSFAYAMMSYNMTQLSNIMWIDGVIMLPLVMLVVYRAVKQKKYGMFYLLTAVNVILNWYTGYMICLFSVFYFLFEWFLHQEELGIKTAKKLVIEFLKFCFVEGLGVVLSGVLFYPVIVGLSNGKPVYDPAIFEMNTKSPLLNLLRGFVLGTVGDMESLSLYCGLPILIFIVFYFLTKKISVRKKVITGIFLGFMLVSCWLLPLDCIWSGLRFAYSYYSRFSFLVIFLMLFIGASACETIDFQEDKRLLIKIAGGYIGILLIFDYLEPFYVKYLLMTIVVLLVYIVIASIKISKRTRAILFAIVLGEIMCNSWLDFRQLYEQPMEEYTTYVKEAKKQSSDIKKYDEAAFLRIEQTSARDNVPDKCTPFFSESMAYDYHGVSQYSSAYDRIASEFITKLGYSDSVDITLYDEAIISADALLGVKYVASPNAIEAYGYEPVRGLGKYNGKTIYKNPYALGLGYKTSEQIVNNITTANSFEYQNQLYSNILGRKVEIFKQVAWKAESDNEQLKITIPESIEGNLYGYMRPNVEELPLYIDGKYRCQYSCWLSYKVFNLGDASKQHQAVFENYKDKAENAEIQFYALDKKEFESAIKEIRENQMQTEVFADGYVKAAYEAPEDGKLLLTVPYEENWQITVNGVTVSQEMGADVLTVIPVKAGTNKIEMNYRVPGVKTGVALSMGSLCIWMIFIAFNRKSAKKMQGGYENEQ